METLLVAAKLLTATLMKNEAAVSGSFQYHFSSLKQSPKHTACKLVFRQMFF